MSALPHTLPRAQHPTDVGGIPITVVVYITELASTQLRTVKSTKSVVCLALGISRGCHQVGVYQRVLHLFQLLFHRLWRCNSHELVMWWHVGQASRLIRHSAIDGPELLFRVCSLRR